MLTVVLSTGLGSSSVGVRWMAPRPSVVTGALTSAGVRSVADELSFVVWCCCLGVCDPVCMAGGPSLGCCPAGHVAVSGLVPVITPAPTLVVFPSP